MGTVRVHPSSLQGPIQAFGDRCLAQGNRSRALKMTGHHHNTLCLAPIPHQAAPASNFGPPPHQSLIVPSVVTILYQLRLVASTKAGFFCFLYLWPCCSAFTRLFADLPEDFPPDSSCLCLCLDCLGNKSPLKAIPVVVRIVGSAS